MIVRLANLFAISLALLAGGCANASAAPGPALDRTRLVPTFSEDFEQPVSYWDRTQKPDGRWKTNYYFSIQDSGQPKGWEARTMEPNKELEYYGNPFDGTDSFDWKKGALTIVGEPTPLKDDPRTNKLPYLSGLITTEKSFSQLYGYFEARIAMPIGKGLWPAFWLLPEPVMKDGWPMGIGHQEIDIFENIGEPNTLHLTVIHDDAGQKVGDGLALPVDIDLTQFHTYGVLVTEKQIVWYLDDHEVRRVANRDFHHPAYMLLNLAIGGEWPGNPDATTKFPARMTIDWVRAYRLK